MVEFTSWRAVQFDFGMNEDRDMFVVDRIKELIKYNEFQVPPAELESVLLTHPDVADPAVLGVYDPEDLRSGTML